MLAVFSVFLRHDVRIFHDMEKTFIISRPSHVYIDDLLELKGGGGIKGRVVLSVE